MNHTIFHMISGNDSGRSRFGAQPRTRSAFMRKDLLAIGLGMFLSGVTVFSSSAAPGDVTLRGHVPAVVAQGRAQARGHLPGDTTLNLSLGLPLRNREALTNLIAQVSDPKSPTYGHYLTPQQFTEFFSPTEKDYQDVIAFAAKSGLKVTKTHANRMLLNVSGKAADVEKTFGVTLGEYQHPTEARQFYAPDRNPSVPAGLQIQDIRGLENLSRPHPFYHIKPDQTASGPAQNFGGKVNNAGTQPSAGTGLGGNYIGDDFRNAYVPGTTLDGSGQSVALVQFDGYLASDIIAYENLTGRPNVPLQNVLIGGFNGLPTGNGGEVEVSLDIEMVISMSPKVAQVIVYEGDPFGNFDPNAVLNQIAVDNSAKQVSCSWGWINGPDITTDQIFQQMAAQGQTFYHASADNDAFLPGEMDSPLGFGQPSSNPFITQVGGTTLTMNGAGSSYGAETVWNWGNRFGLAFDGVGSSGGISTFYSIPSWQTNINMPARGGSATARNVPDVAMTADDTMVIADGGVRYTGVGGTSIAAPLWAGFTALANQQAAINGRPPVGFVNPALYTIARSPSSYAACFNDIVTGNSFWSQSPTLFNSRQGYDLCTGLGTPKTALINTLISFNAPKIHISPPPPPYSTNLSTLSGGNPNGAWFMFVQDDAPVSAGLLANGWILSLATADFVGTAGDLELLMTPTNSTVFVGQPATFVLTVTNYGPSISTNVSISDELPLTATVISTNATQGSVTRAGTTLIWAVGTLAVNSGASLVVTVQPHGTSPLVNSATANAGTPDPNPDEDFATATVNIAQLSTTLTPYLSNGTFHISIPGPTNPSATVIIQANSNLVSTNWVNVYTGTPPINFTDPTASNAVSRFYRALLLP
jgi:uncharacterized repeat protein (TIGR01451 family)